MDTYHAAAPTINDIQVDPWLFVQALKDFFDLLLNGPPHGVKVRLTDMDWYGLAFTDDTVFDVLAPDGSYDLQVAVHVPVKVIWGLMLPQIVWVSQDKKVDDHAVLSRLVERKPA